MATPILVTKLFIPPTRAKLVHRPALIERLNNGLDRKLTLLSAPAGFGKTTLVSNWVETLRKNNEIDDQPIMVSWLSLDEEDNDLGRFLTYFIAALSHTKGVKTGLGQGAISMLQSPQPPSANTIMVSLINDLAGIPEKIVFVLDDFHLLDEQTIHKAIVYLLQNLPPQLHLVIATRQDPHLSLGRMRARSELTELRAADLRFTSSEAADFLNQLMGLNLSPEDIAELETRTEGWIAGLQLAAISMQGRKDRTGFIKSFTGSNRLVLDYLVEDVLYQQPQNVQDFLQATAILNLLTSSLCDALTGQNSGQQILERLERENLFVIPLDEERLWYRYHHLFADLLRQRLKIEQPDLVEVLHSRAVIWYEENGNLSEAVHHAIAKGDTNTAIRLVETGAREALEQSNLSFILNWVERLGNVDLKEHPWLFIYHCWAILLTGQVKKITQRLKDTGWLLEFIQGACENEKRELMGNLAGLRAILAIWQRDFKNGLDFANQALDKLPENNWIRGYCAIFMGSSYTASGNLAAARGAYAESYLIGKASGNMMLAVSGGCNLAYMQEFEGHLQQAHQTYRNLFQLVERDGKTLPVAGYIHVDLARVLYELNALDEAEQHLKEGVVLCQRLADGRAEKIGHNLLGRVQLAKGDLDGVLNSIRNAESADPSPGTSFDLRGGEYPRVRLWLKEKKLGKLKTWVNESRVDLDDISFFKTKLNHTMQARALLYLGREQSDGRYIADALGLLEKLSGLAESNGWGSKAIETLVLKALCYQACGDVNKAVATLEKALTLAEPGGFLRIFVDEGPPMARLLYDALDRGIAPAYVRRLLAAFPMTEPEGAASTKPRVDQAGLIEPLSERELEVLQLIARGLTNQAVATRLYLSLHTIKTHTRNIYSKLGVNNRTQAVVRARILGILPPN